MLTSTVQRVRYTGYILAVPLLIAFLVYVALGNFFSISTSYPTLGSGRILAITVLVCLLVYASILHTSSAIVEAGESRGLYSLASAVILFIITLMFSAYCVFTASMLLFEGPVILREKLASTRETLFMLDAVSREKLRVPELEAIQSRVNSWKQTLMSEIDNPRYCGIGRGARDAIAQIAKDLQSVTVLTGTDASRSCSDRVYLDRLKQVYGDMIDKALREHPAQNKFRVVERTAASNEITSVVSNDGRMISILLSKLDGVSNFIFRLDLFNETVSLLSKVSSDYTFLYQKLRGLVGQEALLGLPDHIDTASVEQLGSSIQVLNTIAARSNRSTTYIYIFTAFFIDLFATAIAVNAISIDKARDAQRLKRRAEQELLSDEIAFIWSPVPHPSKRSGLHHDT